MKRVSSFSEIESDFVFENALLPDEYAIVARFLSHFELLKPEASVKLIITSCDSTFLVNSTDPALYRGGSSGPDSFQCLSWRFDRSSRFDRGFIQIVTPNVSMSLNKDPNRWWTLCFKELISISYLGGEIQAVIKGPMMIFPSNGQVEHGLTSTLHDISVVLNEWRAINASCLSSTRAIYERAVRRLAIRIRRRDVKPEGED